MRAKMNFAVLICSIFGIFGIIVQSDIAILWGISYMLMFGEWED